MCTNGPQRVNTCILYTVQCTYILAVRNAGHLNIKTKVFDFKARVLIGWLTNTLVIQPFRTRTSKTNIFVFMLR